MVQVLGSSVYESYISAKSKGPKLLYGVLVLYAVSIDIVCNTDDEERANECREAVRHNTLNGPPINMRDQMPLRYYAFVTRHASKYMLSASFHVNAFVSHPLKWALSTLLSGILFTYVTFTSSYYHLTYTVIYEPSTITSKDLQPLHEPLICRQKIVVASL